MDNDVLGLEGGEELCVKVNNREVLKRGEFCKGLVAVLTGTLLIGSCTLHAFIGGYTPAMNLASRRRLTGIFQPPSDHFTNIEVIKGSIDGDSIDDVKDRILRSRKLDGTVIPGVDFDKAKKLAKDLLSLIRNRYELEGPIGSQFFLTANNMAAETWDLMKYKFAVKTLRQNQTFLMIFGGSSVTAAHDNYYNQSYPAIVDHRMNPILKALGVDLVVHNIAQGANNCSPYQLCYESMGGQNPDFLGWEQSYNCGHDDPIFELAARIAGFSDNKAVVYYSASGAWSPDKCPPSKDSPPFSNEDWTPESAGLPKWEPTLDDLKKEKDLLESYHKSRASSHRFSNVISDSSYRGVQAHGFNVWEPNPLCKGKKDGKDISACSGIDAAQGCALRFMTHEAGVYGSDNGHGAAWHPTRGFHLLRGEAIAWLYTMTLLDSIYMMEDALKTKKPEDLLRDYTKILNDMQPPMPPPKRCQQYHCELRPVCYTDYRPHYTESLTLKNIIVGKTNWTYDADEVGDWSIHYGYLDSKPLWTGEGPEAGEIHLKVTIDKLDTVWICGAIKESLMHAKVFLDANVKGNLTNYEPGSSRVEWTKRKYVGNECKAITGLPTGTHVLSLSTNGSAVNHKTALSHVIMW